MTKSESSQPFNKQFGLIECLLKEIPKKCIFEYCDHFLDKNNDNHLNLINALKKPDIYLNFNKNAAGGKNFENGGKIGAVEKPRQKNQKNINIFNLGYSLPENPAKTAAAANNKSSAKNNSKNNLNENDSLISEFSEAVIFGRQICDCLGLKHNLINNCTQCGRIVCSLEGEGPCFTCKSNVSLKQVSFPVESGYNQAMKVRNRLLEQQSKKKENTRVFDDQADYFSYENKWLGTKIRQEIQKIEKESQTTQHVVIDLFNEKVDVVEIDEYVEKIKKLKDQSESQPSMNTYDLYKNHLFNDDIPDFKIQTECSYFQQDAVIESNIQLTTCFCLKIDQPWASWATEGLLKFIPYSEFFDIRGPVWIVSDLMTINSEKLSSIANQININLTKKQTTKISSAFPSSVVLGQVIITDCIYCTEMDEQKLLFEVSSAPFLIKVENVKRLIYPLPLHLNESICKIPPFIQNILDIILTKIVHTGKNSDIFYKKLKLKI